MHIVLHANTYMICNFVHSGRLLLPRPCLGAHFLLFSFVVCHDDGGQSAGDVNGGIHSANRDVELQSRVMDII